jgi:hypothetical protein
VEPIITKEFIFDTENITIINIGNENYVTEVIDENSEVTLSITEPESSIESLAAEDFVLLIDGSDFKLGENEGEIFARFNNKSYPYELSQESLTILLKETNGETNQ